MNIHSPRKAAKKVRGFTAAANYVAAASGRPAVFAVAVLIVVIWAASGPIFHYSDTWQLVINTGTTIVTFLMVFLIQNSQNRDSAALQVKLDELIRVSEAKNFLIGIEQLTEDQIKRIREICEARASANRTVAQNDTNTKAASSSSKKQLTES
ncbi:hypothetical protein CU048_07495 [Beijerinckiaceae bacterium]|nr:hypothetical protein CU048_07495 [Beijerinckiaceae bacterium]